MAKSLNGFKVELSSDTFTARVLDMPSGQEFRSFRDRHRADWFLYWREGRLYAIPRVDRPRTPVGKPATLKSRDHAHLHLLAARISDLLPVKFARYEAFRRRPFTFLAQLEELVAAATSRWPNRPDLLQCFKIRPKFELDPRLIELREGELELGLFMRVNMQWSVLATLGDLQAAGIDLTGLHVVRRDPLPGQRALVGKIASVRDGVVQLSEAYDATTTVPESQVWLEGNTASFFRCLKKLLGRRFEQFDIERRHRERAFFTGPALDGLLDRMEDFLRKASPLQLTQDLSCSVAGRVELTNADGYETVIALRPVEYCFDAAKSKRHTIPWEGLRRFGPFDRDVFSKKTPRLLLVSPDRVEGQAGQFIKALRDGVVSLPDSKYPDGLRTLGLVNPAFDTCTVPLLDAGSRPPAELYWRSIEKHLERRCDYDAAVVMIQDQHARLPDRASPYLFSKALLMMAGIPAQEVRMPTATLPHYSLQYTLQNIAVSLYAKLGGVPWTVAQDPSVYDELVIGMGTAEMSGSRFERRQRHVGVTTVFQGDGNYLLSNLSRVCSYDEYPQVLKASTLDVLREVKARNGWRKGDTVRVVFHAFKPLRDLEVADIVEQCVREVGAEQVVQFAFLRISLEHPFQVLDSARHGVPVRRGEEELKAVFVPDRGLMAQLGKFTRLLCTNGPAQIKRADAPLPSPLLIHLHKGSSYRDLTYLTEQVLKFTSLTWRSVQPAEKPVTVYYSQLIAGLLARLQHVPGWSPATLNVKLRSSRWFL